MSERWLPVVGFEGKYEVSDLGHVRSVDRIVSFARFDPRTGNVIAGRRAFKGKLLVLVEKNKGYLAFSPGNGEQMFIHRTVLLAFEGSPPEDKPWSLHGNGDKHDNRLDNLRWGSAGDNSADDALHGKIRCGEKNNKAKLTASQVIEIRNRSSETFTAIAADYGIAKSTARRIGRGLSWKHV